MQNTKSQQEAEKEWDLSFDDQHITSSKNDTRAG